MGNSEEERAAFVKQIIGEHQSSALYKTAKIADDYDRGKNTTIMSYQRMLTTIKGNQIPDTSKAVHRSTSNFFHIFVTQLNQYLLGNGVTWNEDEDERLGKDFDTRLQEAGRNALIAGVSFGFFNNGHIKVFSVLEFAPIYDEENGALAAGVRWWQIDESKPLRATLYEMDGYTDYLWIDKDKLRPEENWDYVAEGIYVKKSSYEDGGYKQPYKMNKEEAEDGTVIYRGENYPSFPIVPLWGNSNHESELIPLREKIEAYDFILNGFEDDLDNAQLYWIIKGAGGMDDIDLSEFLTRLKNVRAAAPADGQEVVPVTVDLPYNAREALLDRLEKQLYRDAMVLNPDDIAGGAATATQIRAAYERQNNKADQYEYCVIDFVQGILAVAGVEDEPTFTRSVIVNTQEEVQTVVMAAQYLGTEYVTTKILTLLGDGDKTEEVLKQAQAEQAERISLGAFGGEQNTGNQQGNGEEQPEGEPEAE